MPLPENNRPVALPRWLCKCQAFPKVEIFISHFGSSVLEPLADLFMLANQKSFYKHKKNKKCMYLGSTVYL